MIRELVEKWRDSYINTSIKRNNLLNQNREVTDAILLKTDNISSYDFFWSIVTDGKYDAYPFKSASMSPNSVAPIEWEAEKDGSKAPERIDKILNFGYNTMAQTGENPICMTFGKLTWYVRKVADGDERYGEVKVREIDGQNFEFVKISTPLILVPVKVSHMGLNYRLKPIPADLNDATVNPSLILKYKQEGNDMFPLPNGSPLIDDLKSFDIIKYFDELERFFSRGEFAFSFEKNYVALDKFDYDKICMYRDVQKHFDKILENKLLNDVFSDRNNRDDVSAESVSEPLATDVSDTIVPRKYCQIFDSDSSQCDVIERFNRGESFILEGPPGTGKTQTIVNMIAEALNRKKRVLFVSGKESALNAAMKKLQLIEGVDIDKHCLLIKGENESNDNNIDDIYKKLRASYGAPEAVFKRNEYEEVINEYTSSRDLLLGYNRELYGTGNSMRMSVYDLAGRMLSLGYESRYIPVDFSDGFISGLTRAEVGEHVGVIGDLQTIISRITDRSGMIENDVWYGYIKSSFDESDRIRLAEFTRRIHSSIERIDSVVKAISEDKEGYAEVIKGLFGYPLKSLRVASDGDILLRLKLLFLNPSVDEEISAVKNEIAKSSDYADAVSSYYAKTSVLPTENPNEIENKLVGARNGYSDTELGKVRAEFAKVNRIKEDILSLPEEKIGKINRASSADLRGFINDVNNIVETVEKREKEAAEIRGGYYDTLLNYDYKPLLGKFNASWSENVKTGKKPFLFDAKIKEIKKICLDVRTADFSVSGIYDLLSKLARIDHYKQAEKLAREKISGYGAEGFSENSLSNLKELLCEYVEEKEAFEAATIFAANEGFKDYVDKKASVLRNILDVAETFSVDDKATVGDLFRLIEDYRVILRENARLDEDGFLKGIFPSLYKASRTDWYNILTILEMVVRLKTLISGGNLTLQEECELFVGAIDSMTKQDVFASIDKLFAEYETLYSDKEWFGGNGMRNHSAERMTLNDFSEWIANLENVDSVTDYVAYKNKLTEIDGSYEGDFYKQFVKADRNVFKVENMSSHYEISILYRYYSYLIETGEVIRKVSGNASDSVKRETERYVEADKKILEFNRIILNNILRTNITRGEKHNYLNAPRRDSSFSVRKLLGVRSESVKELAPCIMMSVYSVSKLLDFDKYNDFDAVIFDEASQIPEEDALTAMMRTSKQIVVAGDPKQMPAVSYFKSKVDSDYFDDEDDIGKCDSIIDLLIQKSTLRCHSLNMHYRSNHESLIRYSNESPALYNGKLITFPSPKAGNEDFGLWDYNVSYENGERRIVCGGNGENETEAKKVVELIRRHFAKNPYADGCDVEEYSAKHSLGVVVFGTHQKEKLEELLNEDDGLKDILSYNKQVFSITTVDNIQGDEMSEMILSLTYGRDKDGKISQSWGHMNNTRDNDNALKKFNVAVTRARDNLKFVHSVSSSEIQSDSLSYVSDYLKQFDGVKQRQFVGDKKYNTDFVTAIGKICESIVGEDRVVYNFGESRRSYRVPVSILSQDKQSVVLGIMCETDRRAEGFSVREYSRTCDGILRSHGWNNLYKTYSVQWIRNYNTERSNLISKLEAVKNK